MKEYAFWDSSSLVPLCAYQPSTQAAISLRDQYEIAVSWFAPVEIRSAISRLTRLRELTSNSQVQALVALDNLRRKWIEIDPDDEIRDRAELFLDRYPLSAADALQLAAAWVWCNGHPRNQAFISGDAQLLTAAAHAGFRTLQV